ncbi:MAG: sigma-70 family RNA polymerase sigma factor [Clostridiales bacterium]|nr:sigma-70 family RNA polymerase sigma factor [Candidatus Cacconaster stercorequi]
MKDQEIVTLLLRHDEAGMSALLAHYTPLMRYIVAPILPNPSDQEDCLSEISMRIWEKIEQYQSQSGSLAAWLTAIARNTAINHARTLTRQTADPLAPDIPSAQVTPEDALLQQERQAAVSRALSRLSKPERALFFRKYYYLQSTAQIARETGTTVRAVEGKLYRLKKKLRRMLGGEAYA